VIDEVVEALVLLRPLAHLGEERRLVGAALLDVVVEQRRQRAICSGWFARARAASAGTEACGSMPLDRSLASSRAAAASA
jgi:hypothetical protein